LLEVSKIIEKNFSQNILVDNVDRVSVKKVDGNLLLRKGSISIGQFSYIFDRANYSQCEIFFAVTNGVVVDLPAEGHLEEEHTKETLKADTIGEELLKLSINPDFLVIVKWNKDDDGACFHKLDCLDDSSEMTIYKMKDFNIKGFHKENFLKAARELAAEL